MICKTKQLNKDLCKIIVLFAFMLVVITGCDKSTDKSADEQSFEIDKKYDRGPLIAHIRIDKTEITIADTLLLEIEAAVKPGYDVNMPNVNEVLANFGIVDWKNLGDKLDENDNVVLKTDHIGIDTKGTLIQGNGRLIATIGLEDMVIVDTDDALLVCAKDKVQDIKKIVGWLQENERTDLL